MNIRIREIGSANREIRLKSKGEIFFGDNIRIQSLRFKGRSLRKEMVITLNNWNLDKIYIGREDHNCLTVSTIPYPNCKVGII